LVRFRHEEFAMPLRDHFRPPVSKHSSWEGFHGFWPAAMVRLLADQLPTGYVAEPRVHLGSYYEIDVSTFENELEQYAYEVLIFDVARDRKLVAAIEIASPANKDRPESRQMFVAKCVNLLQKGVCVSMVDLVTIRHANLYTDLLALIGCSAPGFASDPPSIYAVTGRKRTVERKTRLETWSHALAVGQPLPVLPIWLTESLAVSLDLDACYEETCRVLRIP
jgi:Protein of unknown function (DUF4058)